MKVGIINYGMGNLASVKRALEDLGAHPFIASHPTALFEADRLILPGVGSFREGMDRIRDEGWDDAMHRLASEQRRPLLGICLGMQMLLSYGEEGGGTPGLAYIQGEVRRLDVLGCRLRIPHVGWNDVKIRERDGLFKGIPDKSDFYFVHSFAAVVRDESTVTATVEYGVEVVAAVSSGSVSGTQFHPEKSSRFGRQILQNFLKDRPC